ncbi:MAG: NAD-dependent epimerase/dehydratase family protein [Candidatus Diapherotrites archaeon]|nr:NAD-dependent epimerase/dehydratase family protein [Candidatus Diapherotrites archaeon]
MPLKKDLVLVTGAGGHTGTNVVLQLLHAGRSVRATVRRAEDAQRLRAWGCEVIQGDLTQPFQAHAAVKGCNAVYHCAGVHKRHALNPEREIIQPTLEMSEGILRACKREKVKKVIYASNAIATGLTPNPSQPLNETQWNEHPLLPYARAQTLAEQHARAYAVKYNLNVSFVLPSFVTGPYFYHSTPHIQFILDFIQRRMPLSFEGGWQVVDARDVARAMMACEQNGKPLERYLLAGEFATVQGYLRMLENLTGIQAPAFEAPKRVALVVGEVADALSGLARASTFISRELVEECMGTYACYDTSKARRELRFKPLHAEASLKDTLEWAREKGFWIPSRG